jgi:hypothetical protein
MREIKLAARMLGKKKGYAAVVILTLAQGFGVNTAVFAVVHACCYGRYLKPTGRTS